MSEAVTRLAEIIAADLALPQEQPDATLWARAFVYRDPSEIPPRRWLYKPSMVRGYVTLIVSPGGVGKSTLTMCEAISVAIGRPLLGIQPTERAKVWIWNGEDPADEIERRIHAVMIHHGVKPSDLEGWLFTGSGRQSDLVIAEQDRDGVTVAHPVVDALIEFIRVNAIGLVVIDPFVSSHRVPENDNGAIDRVVKTWGRIAEATGCAVLLVHHTRKTGGQEVSAEDSRGAVALLAAARHAQTLRSMNEPEADRFGIERSERGQYIRIDDGKANLVPPASAARWFRLASVQLGNGDNVQAASFWVPPDPFEGVSAHDLRRVQQRIAEGCGQSSDGWRASVQAGSEWAGYAVAEVFGFDLTRSADKGRVKSMLKTWLASGVLAIEKRAVKGKGRDAPFVIVGRLAEV